MLCSLEIIIIKMLALLARELKWKYYLARHVSNVFSRGKNFGSVESSSSDISGSWD